MGGCVPGTIPGKQDLVLSFSLSVGSGLAVLALGIPLPADAGEPTGDRPGVYRAPGPLGRFVGAGR